MHSIYDDIEKILKESESIRLNDLVKKLRATRQSVSTLEVRAAIIALWEASKVEVDGEVIKAKVCEAVGV